MAGCVAEGVGAETNRNHTQTIIYHMKMATLSITYYIHKDTIVKTLLHTLYELTKLYSIHEYNTSKQANRCG